MIDIGKALQNAYEEGYKQGRYDEKVETEMSLPQRWIPVSERLPEDYQDVLCCDVSSNIMIGYIFEDAESGSGYSAESESEFLYEVVAWMPLPKSARLEKD